jgi:hypothetical protein
MSGRQFRSYGPVPLRHAPDAPPVRHFSIIDSAIIGASRAIAGPAWFKNSHCMISIHTTPSRKMHKLRRNH